MRLGFLDAVALLILVAISIGTVAVVGWVAVQANRRRLGIKGTARGEIQSGFRGTPAIRRRLWFGVLGGVAASVAGWLGVGALSPAPSTSPWPGVLGLGGPLVAISCGLLLSVARRTAFDANLAAKGLDQPAAQAALGLVRQSPSLRRKVGSPDALVAIGSLLVVAAAVAGGAHSDKPSPSGKDFPWGGAVYAGLGSVIVGAAFIQRGVRRKWMRWLELEAPAARVSAVWAATKKLPPKARRVLPPPHGPMGQLHARRMLEGRVHGIPFEALFCHPVKVAGHAFQVVTLPLPASSPGLSVRLRRTRRRVPFARAVEFESAAFQELFEVHATDRRFASHALHPRVLELMQGLGPSVVWHWEGPRLWVGRPGHAPAEDALDLLAPALAFCQLVPPHMAQLWPVPAQA